MSGPAVSVKDVGKRFRRPVAGSPRKTEDFWALRDVTFNVEQGQVCGIIGRNGAGKSTLLKILSRITSPTNGELHLRGRVGCLLEVGTGFHQELSGRQNVFMNGAILGMSRSEIKTKFEEIVDFSGVGAFIDTPVKRYSSGMYTRLAFSVAAHLEPEILIVDEVLAVGDADFQARCLGKMNEVAHGGRTVLFVSHNMNAMRQLCQSLVWLDAGRICESGKDVGAIVNRYLLSAAGGGLSSIWEPSPELKISNEYFDLNRFTIVDRDGIAINSMIRGDTNVWVTIHLKVHKLNPALNFGYGIFNENGELLYWSVTTDAPSDRWPELEVGTICLSSQLPKRLFNEGRYYIDFFASLHYIEWLSEPGKTSCRLAFQVSGGLSDSIYWRESRPGLIAPELEWGRK